MASGQGEDVTVLYVDSDSHEADATAERLERADERLSVRTATSAGEALQSLTDTTIDCLVSADDVGERNGLEILEAVREDYDDLPFILFADSGSEDLALEAVSAGATLYLPKTNGEEQYSVLADQICNAVERACASQRAATERRISRVVREINEALARATTRDDIDEQVCAIISAAEPYRFAWIGEHDPASNTVEPRASAGVEEEYLDRIEITTDDTETGHGPTGQAVRQGELAVLQDIPGDPRYEPWREPALERGYKSSAAIPLDYEDTVYGVLNVYADRREAFDEYERQLLSNLGETIAHAYHRIDLQRRNTEQIRQLERTNALLSTLFDTLPQGVLAEDESREVLAVNQQLFDLFDLDGSPDTVEGADCTSLAKSVSGMFTDPEGFVSRIDELISTREPVDNEALELADGRIFERSYRPLDLPEGAGHLWVYRDSTGRRRRHRELETILERMNDAVLVHGEDSTFMFVNRAAIEQYGYDEAEFLDMRPQDLDVPDEAEHVTERVERVRREGELVFETEHRGASGETFPVEINAAAVRFRGEPAILSIVPDITERKQRERELRRQVDRLDEFASVVSHDLRNPLNVAQGRIDLAREDCDSDHLDDAARGIERGLSLIDDMLTLARAGEQASDMEPVDLSEIARASWDHVETLDANIAVDIDATVRGDRSRLRQLLENLFRNAVEHGSTSPHSQARGDAVEHGSTSPRSQARGDAVEHGGTDVTVTVGSLPDGFYVEDDGPGIPDEHREDVFEPGYSEDEEGTGFGLAIVQQIVEAHDWRIRVTDGEDGGARFEITDVVFVERE
ncbi:PAS domain S-box protein [Halanaeroarchaeum sulfurireducens]|uniref:histidine kinase n=1 Tax=Halanaeroarchaeum sulfurireducens TaxID=1604004 RepID=A0A0N9MGD3_9EURY|nr:PAS domain S-box protein [Halanaeroarchaeum sulfurireducens]ALG81203.1 multi-sensor signal transduction histidine kinase [Halanaeroarchaeum sulfurireducens]